MTALIAERDRLASANRTLEKRFREIAEYVVNYLLSAMHA